MPVAKKPVVQTTGKPVKPDFRGNPYAEKFWKSAVEAYDGFFSEEDTPLLTMACHAWSEYSTAYDDFRGTGGPDRWKTEARVFKWFALTHKMLVALGMTPCQRKNLIVPPSCDQGAESRPNDLD